MVKLGIFFSQNSINIATISIKCKWFSFKVAWTNE